MVRAGIAVAGHTAGFHVAIHRAHPDRAALDRHTAGPPTRRDVQRRVRRPAGRPLSPAGRPHAHPRRRRGPRARPGSPRLALPHRRDVSGGVPPRRDRDRGVVSAAAPARAGDPTAISEDFGARLTRDLGRSTVQIRYNSGRHVSENGADLADLLEWLVTAWPRPVRAARAGRSFHGRPGRPECPAPGVRAGSGLAPPDGPSLSASGPRTPVRPWSAA